MLWSNHANYDEDEINIILSYDDNILPLRFMLCNANKWDSF